MTPGFFPQCTCGPDRLTKCYVHGWADVNIDKVVAAAEARITDLEDTIVVTLRKLFGLPCDATTEDVETYCRAKYPGDMKMSDIYIDAAQAHPQRQRDEGYNEGVEAEVKRYEDTPPTWAELSNLHDENEDLKAKVARLVDALELIARNGALITSRQENDGVRMLTLKALKTLADSEEN